MIALSACGGSSGDKADRVIDSDGDGVEDSLDAFPNDSSETKDSDNDGVGDNADAFPNDETETVDSDSDGVGDNSDAYPQDPNESADTDKDTVADNTDAFPNDPTEWLDSDGDGTGNNSDILPFNADYQTSEQICTPVGETVNFEALLLVNCETLSSYNLFSDSTNPTADVNGGKSLKYELSMPLFTDYATKYRFVVLPENSTAVYSDKEVMDMPVGTVLIKTFSLPMDTSIRGYENETLLETRLLIHRQDGWTALPYQWNSEQTEALYVPAGNSFQTSVTHNSETLSFKYVIPNQTNCKECHQKLEVDGNGNAVAGSGTFAPIGPKARFLNFSMTFDGEDKNQLVKWQEKEMLTELPDSLDDVYLVPSFKDSDKDNLGSMDVSSLNELARGYLDINCAHCHRPIGSANNYGMYLEYDRELTGDLGICKTPIAPPGDSNIERKYNNAIVDIWPGDAENSFLYERLSTDGALKMPKIGRSLVHGEGSELIKLWINSLDDEPYNLGCE